MEKEIRNNEKPVILKKYFHQCSQLYDALEMTSKTFSNQLGLILSELIAVLILTFYRALANFIGNYEFTFPYIIITIGQILCLIFLIFYLLYFILISQHIIDEIQKLIRALQDLPLYENQIALIGEKEYSANYARDLIVKKLESFNGFDVGGLMKLNKGLLPGIAANFVTYLIVLIQFKNS